MFNKSVREILVNNVISIANPVNIKGRTSFKSRDTLENAHLNNGRRNTFANRDTSTNNTKSETSDREKYESSIEMMTVSEARDRLGVNDVQLLDLVNMGALAAYRIGPFLRFKQREVLNYLSQRQITPFRDHRGHNKSGADNVTTTSITERIAV